MCRTLRVDHAYGANWIRSYLFLPEWLRNTQDDESFMCIHRHKCPQTIVFLCFGASRGDVRAGDEYSYTYIRFFNLGVGIEHNIYIYTPKYDISWAFSVLWRMKSKPSFYRYYPLYVGFDADPDRMFPPSDGEIAPRGITRMRSASRLGCSEKENTLCPFPSHLYKAELYMQRTGKSVRRFVSCRSRS